MRRLGGDLLAWKLSSGGDRPLPQKCLFGVLVALCLYWSALANACDEKVFGDWAGKALAIPAPVAQASVRPMDQVLLGLRDFGGLSLSPNGDWLAFSVRQAVPERDSYALAWFVAPTNCSAPPVRVHIDAGEPIHAYSFGLPQAFIPSESARWSSDGRYIAMRVRKEQRVELWVADVTTGSVIRAYDGAAQAVSFAWLSDRHVLIFKTGLNHEIYLRNIDIESAHGWLLNGRMPLFAGVSRPTEPDCSAVPLDSACENKVFAYELGTGLRDATTQELEEAALHDSLQSLVQGVPSADVETVVSGPNGKIAWTENADPQRFIGWQRPTNVRTNASDVRCDAPSCSGQIEEIGWSRRGEAIWFLTRESSVSRADAAPQDIQALYEWDILSSAPRLVLKTQDLIADCHVSNVAAFCMREQITRPRHIVAIDLQDGSVQVIVDANPTWADNVLPRVRKIPLEDYEGNPGFAHIVFPVGYRLGQRYPLVVVQYRSRGFLRGGVGNEYPIFALAEQGFMVLSVDRPEQWRARQEMASADAEMFRHEGLRDRRSVSGAIEAAVDKLIAEGLVDAHRVALTGLSAGAEIVHYALQRTDRYAAAVASSGVHDYTFLALIPEGSARTRLMQMFKSESVVPGPGNALNELSWSRMPQALRTPLLINVGEHEVMFAFEGFAALRHLKRPLEVRVFPGEMHIKYSPRNLAGVYENNLLWLRFWLKNEEDPRPEFATQNARWRAMRDQLNAERTATAN